MHVCVFIQHNYTQYTHILCRLKLLFWIITINRFTALKTHINWHRSLKLKQYVKGICHSVMKQMNTATIIRHTWINQVRPIMADGKQGAGLSPGSSVAVHKVSLIQ